MNTVMKIVNGEVRVTENDNILGAVIASLTRNNTFIPNIDRVIYNLGKKIVKGGENEESYPVDILATTVYFKDGTKVTVKNTIKDKIQVITEKITLSDGSVKEVRTASHDSREIGLMYAIVKRLIGTPSESGEINGNGFSGFLRDQVKSALNQNVESVRVSSEKALKKNQAKTSSTSKKNDHKASLRKVVEDLSKVVESLAAKIESK